MSQIAPTERLDWSKEMVEHVQFTVETGVQIYFWDPKSPWQRGHAGYEHDQVAERPPVGVSPHRPTVLYEV
jgi:transposase, IS30 family